VSQAAPSSTYSLRPPSPQYRYDQPVGKMPQRDLLALIRSTPRQHCLVDRLTRVSTLGQ
jgi:hypothetical protein